MSHVVRLTFITAILFLASCWRDAPMQPAVPPEEETANPPAAAQPAVTVEEAAHFRAALEDAINREVPTLGHRPGAVNIEATLRELVTTLATDDRSTIAHAVRSAANALEMYRSVAPDIAADLAAVDAIYLVLDRIGSATMQDGRER
jgi:hypothetical protein